MDSERVKRVAANEAVFRELNAQLVGLADGSEIGCVCECGELGCVESVYMTREDYGRLRGDPTTFAVRPGHAKPDVEDVVASYAGYEVVRKKAGLPATLARETAS
jgi:hypothetical protein